MKINRQLILFVVFALLLTACKKNNADNHKTTDQPKKLKYLTQVVAVSGATTTTTNYAYDDKNRLITVNDGVSTTTYTYNGNDLFSLEYSNNIKTLYTMEFIYSEGQLISRNSKSYSSNGNLNKNTVGFAYANGKLTEAHNDDGTVYYYSYEGDNLAKITYPTYSTTFTYDDKKNKFFNFPAAIKNTALQLTKFDYASSNNVNSQVNSSESFGVAAYYTYTYDSDGYPTGATLSKTSSNAKYTYVYKEL